MENQTKVRVTVWQPYFSECMLAFDTDEAGSLDVLDGGAELQREVFTWPVEEDIWAGITNDERRTFLQARFTTEFEPTRLPGERSMAKLGDFLRELRQTLDAGQTEWSVASSGIAEQAATPLMVNGLLALHHQLEWLLEMFRDLPGASVSVR